ncbi:hypothetical protein [Kocuria sabuli]|uniref:hypothetical protein n=1 Tax=Kocuria sabuli TaxID=3071448 RepID=UPI0034D5F7D6
MAIAHHGKECRDGPAADPDRDPRAEAVERCLGACRRKMLIRRPSAATVHHDTVDLHRFLELLPSAAEHTTEPVTGARVDEVLPAYANTADHRRNPPPGQVVGDVRKRMAATDEQAEAAGSTLRMRRSLSLMGLLSLRAGEITALDVDHFSRSTATTPASLQAYGKGRTWRTIPSRPGSRS